MPTMKDIEARAKQFAEARNLLAERVTTLQDALDALKRSNLPGIRKAVARCAELEAQLTEMVAESPELFVRPKTVVLHGIKLGYEKGKGGIHIEDEAKVIQLIRKRLPELAEQLIKTEEHALKNGLAQLTVQQLKSIGCTVIEAGERVVIRAVDKDVDKLVTALLRGAQEQAQAQTQAQAEPA
jgi:hypothetical protein